MDQHSWTALMIARAKGYYGCADLLFEHMKTSGVKAAPQAISPSGLVRIEGGTAFIGEDGLTVLNLRGKTFICSNHPIPPHLKTFYYEFSMLSDARYYWCVRVSATNLLDTNSSFLVRTLV